MKQRQSTNGTNVCGNRKKGNIFSYVGFSNICCVIESFPELKQNVGKEGITFPLSSSSIAIECQNENLIESE